MKTPGDQSSAVRACIACGGTGGHLFPGIAVARKLIERGCEVSLMISPKEVDQEAVKAVRDLAGITVVTLPAVGLTSRSRIAFLKGAIQSYNASKQHFKQFAPAIALAMGGFTSAPPILAARRFRAATFLHESNSIPGRANRWLSRVVDVAFVGFPNASDRLHGKRARVTGTPVRSEFFSLNAANCRKSLGMDPNRPVVLVMGGSQGAEGINRLIVESLPILDAALPECQWIHVAGAGNSARVDDAFRNQGIVAKVYGFMSSMDQVMGAATVAISRAGASSLAELAAARIPSILIPYPAATDNHQFHNARAYTDSGAAMMLDQGGANPETLRSMLVPLIRDDSSRAGMKEKLRVWSAPRCAEVIAEEMLRYAGADLRNFKLESVFDSGGSGDKAGEVAA